LIERRLNDRIRFAKNESYWDADHVAMRTSMRSAIESWNSALNLYLTGELDWVDGAIPTTWCRS
jgi:ABC-type oligopeptide transport system substrate-binding subunit